LKRIGNANDLKIKISKSRFAPELQTIAELRDSIENFDNVEFTQNNTFSNDFESTYNE
jgi:hypothetical protein